MSDIVIPKNYKSQLNLYETQVAIKTVKDFFQGLLAERLHLLRVSAPLFVDPTSGLNDNLNGVERPVNFHIAAQGDREAEIVQSLAKWKRYALQKYGFQPGEGLYTDMSAIRQDEETDNIHSIYVDQWDWEKIITKEERNLETLKETVRTVYKVLRKTEKYMSIHYDYIEEILPHDIFFVTTSELAEMFPDYSPKEREYYIAKAKGATTLALVNVKGSSIAREADLVMYTHAGPEISVASTKAFTVQVSMMYLFAYKLAYAKKIIDKETYMNYIKELVAIPDVMEKFLAAKDECQYAASKIMNADSLLYIGRGLDYALSMEGALKLKEISYIHSEAYAAGELKHGPIALISDQTPVVAIATQSSLYEKTVSNIQECKARGAKVVLMCGENAKVDEKTADIIIRIPEVSELVMPVLAAVPLQLIAYYTAVLKGNDVDKPRNLAKSVTVE